MRTIEPNEILCIDMIDTKGVIYLKDGKTITFMVIK